LRLRSTVIDRRVTALIELNGECHEIALQPVCISTNQVFILL
jgi:hypothetical protein